MIRNKYELREAKNRLNQRQSELKNKIIVNWRELKSSLQPKNIISSQFSSKSVTQDDKDSLLVNIFSYSAALLGRKLGEKAEEKLGEFLGNKEE